MACCRGMNNVPCPIWTGVSASSQSAHGRSRSPNKLCIVPISQSKKIHKNFSFQQNKFWHGMRMFAKWNKKVLTGLSAEFYLESQFILFPIGKGLFLEARIVPWAAFREVSLHKLHQTSETMAVYAIFLLRHSGITKWRQRETKRSNERRETGDKKE